LSQLPIEITSLHKEFDRYVKISNPESNVNFIAKNSIKLLKMLGVKNFMIISDEEIRCSCPIHKGDNPTSFVIYPKSNRFICYSKKCNEDIGCTLEDLLAYFKITLQEFKNKIKDISNDIEIGQHIGQQKKIKKKTYNLSLDYLEPYKEYQENRGIISDNIFSYRLIKPTIPLENRAIFIVYDIHGKKVLGFTGRWIDDELNGNPKWKHIWKSDVNSILYFPHTVPYKAGDLFFICEGPIDAIKLELASGIPTVACLGSNLNVKKAETIIKLSEKFIIFADNDNNGAGIKGANSSSNLLKRYGRKCEIVVVPDVHDVGEMSIPDLKSYINKNIFNNLKVNDVQ
jgi:DNA primase